jgi:hypothetical protein
MKLVHAIPTLAALALLAAATNPAEARSRSSFSVGIGYSNYGGYHGGNYNTGVAINYSRGYGGHGHYGHRHGHNHGYYAPQYYAPPPVYYQPAPTYYYNNCGYDYGYRNYYRPVYRPRYYYRGYDCY